MNGNLNKVFERLQSFVQPIVSIPVINEERAEMDEAVILPVQLQREGQPMSKDLGNKLKPAVHNAQPATKKTHRGKVRPDSFSLLQSEHETIQKLMNRAFQNGRDVSKSEIIRAAIKSLEGLNDEAFLQMLESLQRVKAGRPPHRPLQ